MVVQARCPPQSPVRQKPVPLHGKEQFVRPQTRPFQFVPTVRFMDAPARSSNPPTSGPSPDAVMTPGHIVSEHWLLTMRGTLEAYDRYASQDMAMMVFRSVLDSIVAGENSFW